MAVLSSSKIRSALALHACCTLIVMLARAQLLFSIALCSVTVPLAVLYHYVSLRCALYHCDSTLLSGLLLQAEQWLGWLVLDP